MLIALLVPLGLATLRYTLSCLLRAAIAQRVVPQGRGDGARRDHQLLRHARHRLVRADHGLVQAPPAGARPADPCTMLVGHTLPTLAQAVIFLILLGVLVDPVLLVGCVLAVLSGGAARRAAGRQDPGLDRPAGRRLSR